MFASLFDMYCLCLMGTCINIILILPEIRGLPFVLWGLYSLQRLSDPIPQVGPLVYELAVLLGNLRRFFQQVLPGHRHHLHLLLILVSLWSSLPFLPWDPMDLAVPIYPNTKAKTSLLPV